MFIDMDKDLSSASITYDEFVEMVTPRMQNRDSREEIMKVFALFDDDNTGAISFKVSHIIIFKLSIYLLIYIYFIYIESKTCCN
jgi:Ca2+-binding EF-hand superfamily protein